MASIQVKKTKTGKPIHYVVVLRGGKLKWLRAGTKTAAQTLKREIEALDSEQQRERLGLVDEQRRIDDCFSEYLEYVTLRTAASTVQRYRGVLNTFMSFLTIYWPRVSMIHEVTLRHVEDYQRRRLTSLDLKRAADGGRSGTHTSKRLPKPQTVNYEVSVLRSVFVWGHQRGYLSRIPTKGVAALKPKGRRSSRVLSPEECHALLTAGQALAKKSDAMKMRYHAIVFFLNTGLRSGELCHLTWNDVDCEQGLIHVQEKEDWEPKSYARSFFMNESALAVLRSIPQRYRYIFTKQDGERFSTDDMRQAVIRFAKEAGIEGLSRTHDLRHTYNSLMQMNGVDVGTMGKILGHQDYETTMIYTHQLQEHLKRSARKVEFPG